MDSIYEYFFYPENNIGFSTTQNNLQIIYKTIVKSGNKFVVEIINKDKFINLIYKFHIVFPIRITDKLDQTYVYKYMGFKILNDEYYTLSYSFQYNEPLYKKTSALNLYKYINNIDTFCPITIKDYVYPDDIPKNMFNIKKIEKQLDEIDQLQKKIDDKFKKLCYVK